MLQDGGEEKEELHFGQVFPDAHAPSCRKAAAIRSLANVTSCCMIVLHMLRIKGGTNQANLQKME